MYYKLLFIALLGGLAIAGAPLIWLVAAVALFGGLTAIAFVSHRLILKRLLAERGITLVRFWYSGGFHSWSSDPVWWEWREVYEGTGRAENGSETPYSLWIGGPFFALFHMRYEVWGSGFIETHRMTSEDDAVS